MNACQTSFDFLIFGQKPRRGERNSWTESATETFSRVKALTRKIFPRTTTTERHNINTRQRNKRNTTTHRYHKQQNNTINCSEPYQLCPQNIENNTRNKTKRFRNISATLAKHFRSIFATRRGKLWQHFRHTQHFRNTFVTSSRNCRRNSYTVMINP